MRGQFLCVPHGRPGFKEQVGFFDWTGLPSPGFSRNAVGFSVSSADVQRYKAFFAVAP